MTLHPKAILAIIFGVILMLFVTIGAAFVGRGTATVDELAQLPPEVVADRTAPSQRNNPMVPVTQTEASRRTTLHREIEVSRATEAAQASGSSSYIAPPVVTEVRSSQAKDDLTRALFSQNDEFTVTPPAKTVQPKPEPEPVAPPRPAPKVAEPARTPPTKTVAAQPEPDRLAPYRDQYRARFLEREPDPGNRYDFGVQQIAPEKQSSLLGDILDAVSSALVGTAYAGGYVAPIIEEPPILVPYYDGARLNIGLEDLYGPPLPHERSAARPELVGVGPFGSYATQEYHSQRLASQSGGRQVLARAGDLVWARLIYGFNSDDIRGLPIYATISDMLASGDYGPMHGARIEGTIAYTDANATATFSRIILADGREIPVEGIGVADDAARTGFAARVDRHTLQRYGALFISGLLEGVGSIAEARYGEGNVPDVIIVGEGGSVNIDTRSDELTDKELLYGALGPVGRNLGQAAAQGFNRPPTISAPAGHIFGIVFVQTVVYDPATMTGVPAFNPRTGGTNDVAFMQSGGNPAAPATGLQAPQQMPQQMQPIAPPAGQTFVPNNAATYGSAYTQPYAPSAPAPFPQGGATNVGGIPSYPGLSQ